MCRRTETIATCTGGLTPKIPLVFWHSRTNLTAVKTKFENFSSRGKQLRFSKSSSCQEIRFDSSLLYIDRVLRGQHTHPSQKQGCRYILSEIWSWRMVELEIRKRMRCVLLQILPAPPLHTKAECECAYYTKRLLRKEAHGWQTLRITSRHAFVVSWPSHSQSQNSTVRL